MQRNDLDEIIEIQEEEEKEVNPSQQQETSQTNKRDPLLAAGHLLGLINAIIAGVVSSDLGFTTFNIVYSMGLGYASGHLIPRGIRSIYHFFKLPTEEKEVKKDIILDMPEDEEKAFLLPKVVS